MKTYKQFIAETNQPNGGTRPSQQASVNGLTPMPSPNLARSAFLKIAELNRAVINDGASAGGMHRISAEIFGLSIIATLILAALTGDKSLAQVARSGN